MYFCKTTNHIHKNEYVIYYKNFVILLSTMLRKFRLLSILDHYTIKSYSLHFSVHNAGLRLSLLNYTTYTFDSTSSDIKMQKMWENRLMDVSLSKIMITIFAYIHIYTYTDTHLYHNVSCFLLLILKKILCTKICKDYCHMYKVRE